ncbi:hypothetical protein [Clostridium scatologenes]|uniref:Uncharacterized protein n=1 Tax=Clostridium scatologenes TaxID=1548 RepID=A0A0E3JMK7_CLOSL|nr:hypothetical protein [Clostridium scatologenes]AKA68160.1 hypothetical protein CSCA_1035 [Clostridium scatologenes]
MNEKEEILEILNEVEKALQEMFFSGFNSPGDFTLNEFLRLSLLMESCGMSYGAKKLKSIHDKLSSKRHSFDFDYEKAVKDYSELNEYCLICSKKLHMLNLKEKIANL